MTSKKKYCSNHIPGKRCPIGSLCSCCIPHPKIVEATTSSLLQSLPHLWHSGGTTAAKKTYRTAFPGNMLSTVLYWGYNPKKISAGFARSNICTPTLKIVAPPLQGYCAVVPRRDSNTWSLHWKSDSNTIGLRASVFSTGVQAYMITISNST